MKHFFWTFFVLFFLVAPINTNAQPVKLGVAGARGTAAFVAAEKTKELFEAATEKQYEVQIFHGNALGNETDIFEQLHNNTVQIGVFSISTVAFFVPEFNVLSFPFLFKNEAQADQVLDGPFGRDLLALLEHSQVKGMAFSELGFRHVTNNVRPLHTADDIKGLKMRILESEVQTGLWQALGAQPVSLAWPVNDALLKGTIDGQENPLWVIGNYKVNEVQKHLSLTGHVYVPQIIVANLEWFNSLPTKTQQLVLNAAQEAARQERQWNRDQQKVLLENLKQSGIQVVEQPVFASFRQKAVDLRTLPVFNSTPQVQTLLDRLLRATTMWN